MKLIVAAIRSLITLAVCCGAAVITAQDQKPAPQPAPIPKLQLMNDGKRWWVVTIFWQGEDEKHPLPQKYLKGSKP